MKKNLRGPVLVLYIGERAQPSNSNSNSNYKAKQKLKSGPAEKKAKTLEVSEYESPKMLGGFNSYRRSFKRNIVDTISWYKQKGQCFKCGFHYKNKHCLRCPARKAECRRCLRIGHFARVCWNKTKIDYSGGYGNKRKRNKKTHLEKYRHSEVQTSEIESCHEEKRTKSNIRVISIETQTVNEPVKTTNCKTQTVTDKYQVISATKSSSEVGSQTEYKADENLTKIRELEFQLHRVTDIAEQYEDLCHENMLDSQEKEEIIQHLDQQIAALSASDSGKKQRKHKNQPKSVTNVHSRQNKKK